MGDVERARAFGRVAEEYERGRPTYAPEAIRWVLGDSSLEVVDLGAGTGKLTEALIAAGHRVTAVEPLPEMHAILTERLPHVRVRETTAEATGLPDGSADAVVAGAAFHWFDHSRALAEIVRILRPPGILGLLGNGFDPDSDWAMRLREVLGESRLGRPGNWPSEEELMEHFADVHTGDFPHQQTVTRPLLHDLALSRSHIAMMSAAEQGAVLERLDALWGATAGLDGQPSASLPYRTGVTRCTGLRSTAIIRDTTDR
jgi:SAM-dependent methyltransferase